MQGSLSVQIQNQSTFISPGNPLVQDARIILRDFETGQVIFYSDDVDGSITISDIPVGAYNLEVSANGHVQFIRQVTVTEIGSNEVAFLFESSATITRDFSFVEIEAIYSGSVESEFNSVVPESKVALGISEVSATELFEKTSIDIPTLPVVTTIVNDGFIDITGITLSSSASPYFDISSSGVALDLFEFPNPINAGGTIGFVELDFTRTGVHPINIPAGNDLEALETIVLSTGYNPNPPNGPDQTLGTIQPVVRYGTDQILSTAREGLELSLTLDNAGGTEISNIDIVLNVREKDEIGPGQAGANVGNETIAIAQQDLSSITAIDGTGRLAAGETGHVDLLLLPTTTATELSDGTYSIGATVTYTQDGQSVSQELQGVNFKLAPQPELHLNYFLDSDVFGNNYFLNAPIPEGIDNRVGEGDSETGEFFTEVAKSFFNPVTPFNIKYQDAVATGTQDKPFELALLVENQGTATASNLTLASGQLEKSNDPSNLLNDVETLQVSVNGIDTPSVTVADFGDLDPGQTGVAVWANVSSLDGSFSALTAALNQDISPEAFGLPALSSDHGLVKSVNINTLVERVLDDRAGADTLSDFLTQSDPDPNASPDRLHLSEGGTETVAHVQAILLDQDAKDGSLSLEASVNTGWSYVSIIDPSEVFQTILGVQRSDGKLLSLDNVWTSNPKGTEGLFGLQNTIHILDHSATPETYTYTVLVDDISANRAPSAVDDTFFIPNDNVFSMVDEGGTQGSMLRSVQEPFIVGSLFDDNGAGTDSDPDADKLTVAFVDGKALNTFYTQITDQGSKIAINNDGQFAFWGAKGSTEAFQYTVRDPSGATSTATAIFTTEASNNTPPVARDDTILVSQNVVHQFDVTDNDNDADSDALSITRFDTLGTLGSVQPINLAGVFNYTPPLDFVGQDSFTYTLSDGGNTTTATVVLNVEASSDAFFTDEDMSFVFSEFDFLDDAESYLGNVTFPALSPNVGTVETGEEGFVFTPAPDLNGLVTFSYVALDSEGEQITGTLNVNIAPIDDAPQAIADAFSTPVDTQLVLTTEQLLSNDDDGDPELEQDLEIIEVIAASPGDAVEIDGNTITYTPAQGFSGQDTFTYVLRDPSAQTSTGTVTVNVKNDSPNAPPVAIADGYLTDEDTQIVIAAANGVLENDNDPDSAILTAQVVTNPNKGLLELQQDGSFTYLPFANANGEDEFTYEVSDGVLKDSSKVIISINPINDLPEVVNTYEPQNLPEDTVIDLPLAKNAFVDVDGDRLTFDVLTSSGGQLPTWLVFNQVDQSIEGLPPLDFSGQLDLVVTASDTQGAASTPLTLIIDPVNDAPQVNRQLINQKSTEDVTVGFTIAADTFTDVDSAELVYEAALANGDRLPDWLVFNANTLAFSGTPPLNFNGTLDIRVIASDGQLETDLVFTLIIEPVNDDPLAIIDVGFKTNANTKLTISSSELLANDSDPENDVLIIASVGNSVNGNASINADGIITFLPAPNFAGKASFQYLLSDGNSGTDMATVEIDVNELTTAPTNINVDTLFVNENVPTGTIIATLSAEDIDQTEGHIFTFVENPEELFKIDENRLLTNGPLDFETATSHTIGLRAVDDDGQSITEIFTIQVNDLNDTQGGGGGGDNGGTNPLEGNAPIGGVDAVETVGDARDNVFTAEEISTIQRFDGGNGDDSLTFPGNLSDFTISLTENGFQFTNKNGQIIEPLNIEILVFDDRTVQIETDPNAKTIAYFYELLFDRTADVRGLSFWHNTQKEDLGLRQILDNLLNSEEFTTAGADISSNEGFIQALYANGFDRPADELGLEHWLNELDNGTLSRSDIVLAFSSSAELLELMGSSFDNGVYLMA